MDSSRIEEEGGMSSTHEQYIAGVREAVVAEALRTGTINEAEALTLSHTKLLYGIGDGSYRGVCHYQAWENGIGKVDVIEIAATAEESWIQLAGTTIHELGHVLAGIGEGHGNGWKACATRLGLRLPVAAGQQYRLPQFPFAVRVAIVALAERLGDGRPEFRTYGLGFRGIAIRMPRPCSAGVGTRGGKSRGKGSGSRQRLWECDCERPVKVRVASDTFEAHCDVCGGAFHKVEKIEQEAAR